MSERLSVYNNNEANYNAFVNYIQESKYKLLSLKNGNFRNDKQFIFSDVGIADRFQNSIQKFINKADEFLEKVEVCHTNMENNSEWKDE